MKIKKLTNHFRSYKKSFAQPWKFKCYSVLFYSTNSMSMTKQEFVDFRGIIIISD